MPSKVRIESAVATKPVPEQVDVAVIGGGPAGSTCAALLSEQGWSVALLEKDEHPRFHIGESLLPRNMLIFRRLGVIDQLKSIGVFKPGVDFTAAEPGKRFHEIRFSQALDVAEGCDHAYQVRRSEFDRMLFENARASGAQVFSKTRVRDAIFKDSADPELTVSVDNRTIRMRARFVVDASGRDALLARKFDLQERNLAHGTAAMYGHFRNVPRRMGTSAGNISIYWFDEGWIWMIPLPGDIMSVGAVCNPGYLRNRGRDVAGYLHDTIARNPHAASRMADAEAVSKITATGNYSYYARCIDGPRWLMIGDAGIFVDPVFSSGVYLGMHGAECAARVVDAELTNDLPRARAERRRFRKRIRRGVREFSWFIYRFPAPVMRQMFLAPRNIFGVEQSVISVLSGDVFDNARVRLRIRLFRLIYTFLSLFSPGMAWRARRQRMRNAQTTFDREA